MLEDELKRNHRIQTFVQKANLSEEELRHFLTGHAGHPDYYVDHTLAVARNLAKLNYDLFLKSSEQKRFHLVKALCLTVDIAFSMRHWGDELGGERTAWFWKGYPLFFSSLHNLTQELENLQKEISNLEEGFTGRVILLEGDSERRFLEVVQLSRLASFDVPLYVYGGQGAVQNLKLYIRDKNEKGMRVQLAYDGDGGISQGVPKLQQQVQIYRVFRFERDFEGSFPPRLLAGAITKYLQETNSNAACCTVEEAEELLSSKKPFVKATEEKYGISISKTALGQHLAIELLELSRHEPHVLSGEGSLAGYELSRFLRFVMDWPEHIPHGPAGGEPTFDEIDV